jgi:hypothetical protein
MVYTEMSTLVIKKRIKAIIGMTWMDYDDN